MTNTTKDPRRVRSEAVARRRLIQYPGTFYWISFVVDNVDGLELALPCWISGYDPEGRMTVCCAIPAANVEDAQNVFLSSFDTPPNNPVTRFAIFKEVTPDTFGPNSRFRIDSGMIWHKSEGPYHIWSTDDLRTAIASECSPARVPPYSWGTFETPVGTLVTGLPLTTTLILQQPRLKTPFIGFEFILSSIMSVGDFVKDCLQSFTCVNHTVAYDGVPDHTYTLDEDGFRCLESDLVDIGVPTITQGVKVFLHARGIIIYAHVGDGVWTVKAESFPLDFAGPLTIINLHDDARDDLRVRMIFNIDALKNSTRFGG